MSYAVGMSSKVSQLNLPGKVYHNHDFASAKNPPLPAKPRENQKGFKSSVERG